MPYALRPPERVSGGSPNIRQSPKQKDTRKPESSELDLRASSDSVSTLTGSGPNCNSSDANDIFKVKTDFFHEPKYVMINIIQKKFFFYRHCISSQNKKGEFMTKRKSNFIMLPTVDFCFKELMQNPKVRKGFIAALLNLPPEKITDTVLMPTILRKKTSDGKIGILDVRVMMKTGTQLELEMQVAYFEYWENRILFYLSKMYSEQVKAGESYEKLKKCIHVSVLNFVHFPNDEKYYRTINLCDKDSGELYSDLFELKILELAKLPKHTKSKEKIVQWMKFFNGKTRKEFEDMAKTDEYLNEAYQTLLTLSADESKRLEYEAREKALKDYNTQMYSAEKRGEKRGERRGEKRGERRGEKRGENLAKKVFKLHLSGNSDECIAKECAISLKRVRQILN